MHKRRVLFLCTGNSCRSHMAEGWLRQLASDRYEALSAGAKPAGYVHPLAIKAMTEVGVDISRHTSKALAEFDGQHVDYLITVCDNAREACSTFTGSTQQLHWSFDDPAHATGNDAQKLRVFRRVREEIHRRIQLFVETQNKLK